MRPYFLIAALLLASCGTQLPMAQETSASAALPYFTDATSSLAPPIERIVGPVEGHSCKNLATDPPATEEAALRQLRARAASAGANGIVGVSFSRAGTRAFSSNCWQSVSASGTAVVFRAQ